MQRHLLSALALSAFGVVSAQAEPMVLQADQYSDPPTIPALIYADETAPPAQPTRAPVRVAAGNLGGGFIEFLFSGIDGDAPAASSRQRDYYDDRAPRYRAQPEGMSREIDPRYLKQIVNYTGHEKPGTIVIDTPNRFLFLVQDDGTALRYGIGVGKPGFTWAGEKTVSAKKEWPDWTPPEEMLRRRPDLPHFMAGGPDNPLGARAMYLGSTLYRIHGSNEPWTIGHAVSSGCIRMRNEDVIDLYERVQVGAKVRVI
jgi:lipoprotein-anchoring transpeptidase ErfK/SrfK